MGLLDNIMGNEPCTCCLCDIDTRPGCPHGRSKLRLPICETCPAKALPPPSPQPEPEE